VSIVTAPRRLILNPEKNIATQRIDIEGFNETYV